MGQGILDNISFANISGDELSRVNNINKELLEFLIENETGFATRYFFESYKKSQDGEIKAQRTIINNRQERQKINFGLQPTFSYYENNLLRINPVTFKYLSDEKREAIKRELALAFYYYCARYELNYAESQQHKLTDDVKNIERCALHLKYLHDTDLLIQFEQDNENKKNLLNTLSGVIKDEINELKAAKLIYLQSKISWLNLWRLYWVWTSCLLDATITTIIAFWRSNRPNTNNVSQALSSPALFFGWLSVILYPLRFLTQGLIIFKHIVAPSEEERRIMSRWQDRLNAQWKERKFVMLNDLIWGIVNAMCFFRLHGNGMPGYLGNVLTLVLLAADLSLTIWRLSGDKARHAKLVEKINSDINNLEKLIKESQDSQDHDKELKVLREQLKLAQEQKSQYALDWKYKERKMLIDGTYSVVLLLGFFVLVGGLLTIAVPPIAYLVGALMLFIPSLVYTGANLQLNVTKEQEIGLLKLKDSMLLLENFAASTTKELDFLQYKQLEVEILYQEKVVTYHKFQLARSMTINALAPVVLFCALTFAPLGAALGVLSACFVLAVFSSLILKHLKPQQTKFISDEVISEINKFGEDIEAHKSCIYTKMGRKNSTLSKSSIFSKPTKEQENHDNPPTLDGASTY